MFVFWVSIISIIDIQAGYSPGATPSTLFSIAGGEVGN